MERPIIRMAYRHFKGDSYVVLGFAEDEKSKEEMVIYSSLENGKTFVRPLASFFDIHPNLKIPRFQLVTPNKKT